MSRAGRVRQLLPPTNRFGDIRWLDVVDSTNRLLAEEARAGAANDLVVIAEFQTAGRGRLERRWEAPAGSAMLLSVLIRPVDLDIEHRHLVTAAVAIAARLACVALGAPAPELKWPNDLLGGGRKLAGVLAEAVDDAIVVGIGCNVSSAPPGAVSLDQLAGRPVERVELVAALLTALDGLVDRWDEVALRYREACGSVGQRVRVETASGSSDGDALAIDEAGRLVVRFDDQRIEALSAGDVTHLRPADAALGWGVRRRPSPPIATE